jgi:hypothetical protein
MARLSDRDEHAWQVLADRVAVTIEPKLSARALANRTVGGHTGRGPIRFRRALRRARRSATTLARGSEAVIRTDVRSFYPSVTPSVAFDALVSLKVDPAIATGAAWMLDGWGSEGYGGLPIGPPGSAVIANAVLASVDAGLEALPFLRWVDDYLIGLPDESAVPLVLERLDDDLARLYLERSLMKTEVLSGKSFTWPGTYLCPRPSE